MQAGGCIRSWQTRNRTTGLDISVQTMSTYNVPGNTESGAAAWVSNNLEILNHVQLLCWHSS